MRADPAILEALDLFKQPFKVRSLHRQELPSDMLTVIKIAAGEQQTTEAWAESCGETSEVIRQAAVFFLQQTIAKSGHDRFRTLGLPAHASKDDIRIHKRWLLKWLHPDRNPSKWETTLFHRVSSVAETLEATDDGSTNTPQPRLVDAVSPRKRRHHRRLRVESGIRSPIRQISWRSLARRLLKRALLAIVLLSVLWIVAAIIIGPTQKSLWSLISGM